MGTEVNIDNPDLCPELVRKIDGAWEEKVGAEKPRPYLGISIIGHPCKRYLFLNFRWVCPEDKPGRLYRLFDMGHREEDVAVANLKMAGIDIRNTGDDQLDIDFGCHVKGHPDGWILSGVPGAMNTEHIWEHKTANDTEFKKLQRSQSVKETKPEHYAQMQCGMLGSKLVLGHTVDRALYQVLNKNTSEIYMQRVRFDKDFATELIERGQQICIEERLPAGLSTNPAWEICKRCAYWNFCFLSHETTTVTCRNCAHSTPTKDGKWTCSYFDGAEIPVDAQYNGCDAHCFHPDLVPWELDSSRSTMYSGFYWIDKGRGIGYLNGFDGIKSKDLLERLKYDRAKGLSEESDNITF